MTGWSLTWAFAGDQRVGNAWNAEVTQSGTTVTARNLAWNGTVSANGGRVSFGFTATGTSATAPTSFAVNGTTCTR